MTIPIIGEPGSALLWYPTAIVACKCQSDKGIASLLVLTGFGNHVACGHCGWVYAITAVGPEGVSIAYVRPNPSSAVQ